MTAPLILASSSAIRAALLRNAGLAFEIARPEVDEEAIRHRLERDGASLEKIALRLAEAKALAIDAPADACVIGADQILEFRGRAHGKARTFPEARARLAVMQGEAHSLINAVAVARSGEIVFRHVDAPRLFMRAMSGEEIDRYLAACPADILASVGAYQVEALGARLFTRIEGDYFAVLGLALLPLLAFLREAGAADF